MARSGGIELNSETTSKDNITSSASTLRCRMRVKNSSADFAAHSIPPDLAIDTLDGLLLVKYDETDQQLKRVHIIELLELCIKTFFTFKVPAKIGIFPSPGVAHAKLFGLYAYEVVIPLGP
ncbi:hypothetical protein SprV_0200842200 [Sparganum proliferum]